MRLFHSTFDGRDLQRMDYNVALSFSPEHIMTLTDHQKRHLKKLGHGLKPVVTVGQAGLSAGVCAELEIALDHHELLKVKVNVGDREERDRIIDEMLRQTGAESVQRIGNVAVMYRFNPKKKAPLELPK